MHFSRFADKIVQKASAAQHAEFKQKLSKLFENSLRKYHRNDDQAQQYKTSTHISMDNLQPGDLSKIKAAEICRSFYVLSGISGGLSGNKDKEKPHKHLNCKYLCGILIGASKGNRTLNLSLGSSCFTTKLCSQLPIYCSIVLLICQVLLSIFRFQISFTAVRQARIFSPLMMQYRTSALRQSLVCRFYHAAEN